MLMQNFKSAEDLGITEPQKEALMKTLVLLETGKLTHVPANGNVRFNRGERQFTGHFNMEYHYSDEDCGTVCCISGTAELIGGVRFHSTPRSLHELFYPMVNGAWGAGPAQAATALRSYLTTGDARWDLAVA